MQAKELIRKKRDGGELTPLELKSLIDGLLSGEVKEYQVSAWLMAVFFRGMSPAETAELTRLMWQSGVTVPRSDKGKSYYVDKHSTGGVGDKPSLILVPVVTAAARRLLGKGQLKIPMVSGRALGHSGGTLDKMESVPGFRTALSLEEALRRLEADDYFMMGQTEAMAPADRILYGLRDATSTVESLPLIVSSIMSKKLSENLDGLVIDVKAGSGAFLGGREASRALAVALKEVAERQKIDVVAILTNMDEPLGWNVGNSLEIEECADFLLGKTRERGLLEVVRVLAAWMLHFGSRKRLSLEASFAAVDEELASERAYEILVEMFESQEGRWNDFTKKRELREKELKKHIFPASRPGFLRRLDAKPFGLGLNALGGGRLTKEAALDSEVGFSFTKKVGDSVRKGEPIFSIYYREPFDIDSLVNGLSTAVEISESPVAPTKWILETLS